MSEIVSTWFPVVSAVVALAAAWGLFVVRSEARAQVDAAASDLRKEFKSEIDEIKAELKELDAKVDKQDRRLIQVEEQLKAIQAIGENIQAITNRLGDMREQMAGMSVKMEGLQRQFTDGQHRTEAALKVMDETLRERP